MYNNKNKRNGRNSRNNTATYSKDSFSQNLVGTINNAIQNDYIIKLEYYSREKGITKRVIEPMDIIYRNGVKNLAGWCRLRDDWRTFRIDRIVQIVIELDETFEPREDYRREDFEDEDKKYNDVGNLDLPYSTDKVRTMSENKLNLNTDESTPSVEEDEDLSL